MTTDPREEIRPVPYCGECAKRLDKCDCGGEDK